MSQIGPIGVFDSGYGGLTILTEIKKQLPEYDFVYLGDNARSPYGNRSFENVYDLTLRGVKYLFHMDCPLVILACNTASAKALRSIQQNDLPKIAPMNRVLGVVRPTVEAIGSYTKNNDVGILATEGTVSSRSYVIELNEFFPEIDVVQEACPMWVSLVENNERDNAGVEYFVERHISNLIQNHPSMDVVVLACTHFPILIDSIRKCLDPEVKILEQGEIVAEKLEDYLLRHPEINERCTKNGELSFFTTDDPSKFDHQANLFSGIQLKSTKVSL